MLNYFRFRSVPFRSVPGFIPSRTVEGFAGWLRESLLTNHSGVHNSIVASAGLIQ